MSAVNKILNDPKYNGLDDLSKIMFPWTGKVFEEISSIQDIPITKSIIDQNISGSRYLAVNNYFPETSQIMPGFLLDGILNFMYEATEINATLPRNIGPDYIAATFKKKPLDDDQMVKISSEILTAILKYRLTECRGIEKPRAVELIDIFTPKNFKSEEKHYGRYTKRDELVCVIRHLIDERKLQIRDSDLLYKIVCWICEYVAAGNKAALANLLRVKIAMHEDQILYSIEEII